MKEFLLCWLFLTVGTHLQAGVILSINPASQSARLGSPTSFHVDVSGLGGGTALGTYDINLAFDPTVLSYESIVFGNQVNISGLGDIQSVEPGTGGVEVFELSLDSPTELNSLQASAFTLATLSFDTLAFATNSPLNLSVNALGDAYGNSISASAVDGSISVNGPTSAVPEANPKLLLLVLLPSLAALRMTFKRMT